jgi:predicted lysophospholipase L1 biosynthesis ABC-type transport system permease subunit
VTIWIAVAIVRASAFLAPAGMRARWREEWLAEVDRAGREGRSALTVAIRTLGAPVDAVALRWTTRRRTGPAFRIGAHAEVSYSSAVLSGLAFITSVLAAFGVYSVLAYAVTRRRRELGIRIALGADRARIARDVARQVVWVLVPGLVAGTAAAAWSAELLSGLLYEVTPRDPAVFAAAIGLVAAVSTIAAIGPARSAGRVDPIGVLRAE